MSQNYSDVRLLIALFPSATGSLQRNEMDDEGPEEGPGPSQPPAEDVAMDEAEEVRVCGAAPVAFAEGSGSRAAWPFYYKQK